MSFAATFSSRTGFRKMSSSIIFICFLVEMIKKLPIISARFEIERSFARSLQAVGSAGNSVVSYQVSDSILPIENLVMSSLGSSILSLYD